MRIVTHRQPRTKEDTPSAVAMGYFDGMHIGHISVIQSAKEFADAMGLRLAVFTFSGKKAKVHAGLISNEKQKHDKMAGIGVDTCYQPFFDNFAALSPEGFFYDMLLGEYNAKALFCGENFHFGANRAGNVQTLQKLCAVNNVKLSVVPTAGYKGEIVSSTAIKQNLKDGDVLAANAMLGRPYEVFLPVESSVYNEKEGFLELEHTVPENLCLPADGMYITKASVGGEHLIAVTGFGMKDIDDSGASLCKTFLFECCKECQNKEISIQFFEKISEIQMFEYLSEQDRAVKYWGKAAEKYFNV